MSSFTFTGSATSSGGSGATQTNYPINTYVTLDTLRDYLSLGSQNTTDDDKLVGFTRDTSRAIDKFCRRHFYPNRKVNYYNDPDGDTLRLEYDLISVVGLSHMNGASEIDSSVYWLQRGDDPNLKPYDRIVINSAISGSTFNFSTTPERSVHLEAFWGYNENGGWLFSGTCVTADVSSSVRTIQVGGSIGQDANNESPRFQPGHTLLIDNELMMIDGSNGISQINVRRNINAQGVAPASHASNVPIYKWDVDPEIQTYAKRLSAWMYMQSQSPYGNDRIMIPGYGDINIPGTWPKDIKSGLERFKKSPVKKVF